jgi:hypothetical protein
LGLKNDDGGVQKPDIVVLLPADPLVLGGGEMAVIVSLPLASDIQRAIAVAGG